MGVPYAEVIGDPIAHSKSPMIHKFWLGKLGMEGDYLRTQVTPPDLAHHLGHRRLDREWRGCNLTMPLKQIAAASADSLSPEVLRIGAVNALASKGSTLEGCNTDYGGFLEPLRRSAPDCLASGNSAIVIGAGGAAAAVAAALWDEGLHLQIANRNRNNARVIADRIAGTPSAPIDTPSLLQLRELSLRKHQPKRLSLIVNASAMGMEGKPQLDISLSEVAPEVVIYDLVYNPVETRLIAMARERGLRTVDGLEMLVGQAAIAFELFFGASAPREHDAELRELLTR